MRIILVISAILLSTATDAKIVSAMRCEYPSIPTVTIYYDSDTTGGVKGVFSVADSKPEAFSGGMGSSRVEGGDLGGYSFQWTPANDVMDVRNDSGNLVISEQGRCFGAEMEAGKAKILISAKKPEAEPASELPNQPAKRTNAPASGSCEIEDWTFQDASTGRVEVSGSTTCSGGKLNIRFYDGEKFLGADYTYIEGYLFKMFPRIGSAPDKLKIRYTISTD